MYNGVLYRRFRYADGRADVLQLLLPRCLQKDFMTRVHAGMAGGHLGIRRTLDQVRRRAFWRGWRRDVQTYCRQCDSCASYHRGNLPRTAPEYDQSSVGERPSRTSSFSEYEAVDNLFCE